jgi:hypothetical protein
MTIYKICLFTKGKRRYFKIVANSPAQALKQFRLNMFELAYSDITIEKYKI